MIKDNFVCSFAIYNPDKAIIDLINEYDCEAIILSTPDEDFFLKLINKDTIVVLDGYEFNKNFRKKIREKALRLVVIDDHPTPLTDVDMIVNYSIENYTNEFLSEESIKFLIGLQYLLVRKPFIEAAKVKRSIEVVENVLICMGGSDPFNVTCKVIQACQNLSFIKRINVVLGSGNLHYKQVSMMKSVLNKEMRIFRSLTALEIAELVRESHIVFATASSIALEICCIKAGLIIGFVAQNQKELHAQLLKNNVCESVNEWQRASISQIMDCANKLNDIHKINKMMISQSILIDGHSDERIKNAFNEFVEC